MAIWRSKLFVLFLIIGSLFITNLASAEDNDLNFWDLCKEGTAEEIASVIKTGININERNSKGQTRVS